MASDNSSASLNVPGFRKQAKTVAATVLEREKREKLTADVTRFATELAGFTKEHVTDAEKRSALLRYAKGLPRQAVTTAKDPAARAHLLDKLKTTMTTVQQAIKDPTKRQELHDSLAATTHNLMTSSGLVSPGPISSGLASPGPLTSDPASPGLTSPGLMSPGLASPGLASSGRASPGLRSPGPASPGLAPPGLMSPCPSSPGLISPSLQSPGLASPGLASSGRASPGPGSPGLMSPAVVSSGLALSGQASQGLTSPGPGSPGLMSAAVASPGLESSGPGSPGLMSPGLAPLGLISPGLASPGLVSPDPESSGLESSGLASPGPALSGLAPPGLVSLGPASSGLASPGLASSGPGSPGRMSPGLAPLGLASPGPGAPGPDSPGLMSPAIASPGLMSPGPASPGLVSPDVELLGQESLGPLASGLASPGLASPGAVSSGLTSPGLASPGPAPSGLASFGPASPESVLAGPISSAPGLATPGLVSSGLASSDLAPLGTSASACAPPGLASPGLASPATPDVFEGAASISRPVPPSPTAGRMRSPPAAGQLPSTPAAARMPSFPTPRQVPSCPVTRQLPSCPTTRQVPTPPAAGVARHGWVLSPPTAGRVMSPPRCSTAVKVPTSPTAGKVVSPSRYSTAVKVPTPPSTGKVLPPPTPVKVPLSPTAGKELPPPTAVKVSSSPTAGKVLSTPTAGQLPLPLTPRQRGQPFLVCSEMQRPQQQQQQQQQPKKQACKVFISHARERKSIVASSLHTLLTQAAGISTFLDERGLIPGTANATAMEFEIHNAPVVVLLLTKDYMRKKWPMWELDIALKRRCTPSCPAKLIPVLVDISLEELGDLSGQLYHHESWIGRDKPTDEDLQQWAALGSEAAKLVCIRKDQGLSTSWAGDLQQLVMSECIAALQQMKLLPPDYTLRDPRRLPMFVSKPDNVLMGRATELESMRRGLLKHKRVIVTGGPGEGKTALARSVAGQLYNDGCFLAGAFEVDMTAVAGDAREALASLLVPYLKQGLGNSIAADDPPNWKTLERWLQMNVQPWVLLLDNTEELIKQYKGPNNAQKVLDSLVTSLFSASRGGLHLIIVSRTSTLTLPQAAVCQLQPLPESDAMAVLRNHCPKVWLTDAQAADVSKACGCNPLELQLIGGLLNLNRLTPKAVLAKARAAKLLADTMVGDPFAECTERLVQWWKLLLGPTTEETSSWHLFSKRRQPVLAVAALATFAGSFSAGSAQSVAGAVCSSHSVALADLRDMGVLQDASSTSGLADRYEMHHLHRKAADQLLREAPDQQQAAVHAFIGCTLQIAQQLKQLQMELFTSSGGSATGLTAARKVEMLSCLPVAEACNITHMLGLLEQLTTSSPSNHSVNPDWQPQVASDLVELARELYNVAHYHLAEPLYQRALAIREKVLGPKHPDTASTLNNLALLLKAQGKLAEAEPLYRRNLAINEEVLGSDHSSTATSLNNLAELLQDQGKLAEAESMYRRALAIREEVLGPDHPDTASTLNNLAGLLQDEGKLAEAEPLCRRGLAICEEVVGPEHPHTACSLNNLALLLEAQGKLAEAEPLYKRALAICEKVLGPKHPHTAISVNNVAIVLWAQGKLAEAKPMCQRALAIREEVLGPDHPDTVTTRNNLTRLMQNRGKLAR